jgi:hypothetical protein
MKKCFSLLIATQIAFISFCQTPTAGQLKVTIESFKCLNKSWDGFVEFDGHGNEVFLNYAYRIYDPSQPGYLKPGAAYTSIYGSTGNGRIKTGTASAIGGIDNGNTVHVGTVILNEHINANDLILISPSIWEWDNGNNANLNLFNSQLANDLNWAMLQPYPFENAAITSSMPFEGRFIKMTDKYNNYWPITKYNFLKSLVNVQENRPVGLKSGTFNNELLALYNPTLLVLDTRVLISYYNHNKRAREINHREGPKTISGLIENVTTEDTYAVTTSNGSYSITLRIEYTPDPVAISPPPPLKTKATKSPVIHTFPTQVSNSVYVNVTGRWTGTFGNGESATPHFYSFQFNADGTIQLYSNTGIVLASGTYTQNMGVLKGNYRYKDGSEFSISANVTNKTMQGTWGLGKNEAGAGKWTMSKN